MARTTKTVTPVAQSIESTTPVRTAEQQAALDAMRAAKAAAPEVLEASVVESAAEPVVTDDVMAELNSTLGKLQAHFGITSVKRYLSSALVSFAASFGVGYLGGILVATMWAALTLSGWAFLAWVVAFIGVIVTLYLAMKAGRVAFDYIAMKRLDAHAEVCWGFVKGIFSSDVKMVPSKPAAA